MESNLAKLVTFRPLAWLTVLAVPALAVLVGLGTWQLERRAWKEDLIAAAAERTGQAPVPLPAPDEWRGLDLDQWEYRPVRAEGVFGHEAETHVYTLLSDPNGELGGTGYWVVTPLALEGAGVVLVNRGFVPDALKDPALRPDGQDAGRVSVTGLVRKSETSAWFVPAPDLAANVWYARDVAAIAEALGLGPVAPFLIDQHAGAPGAVPQGGETRLAFRNEHLGYALTWYGLAGALVVIYFAFHRARGRLGRTR